MYGDCDRLSPEAPVPILNMTHVTTVPGMAGNAAENAKAFTENIELVTQPQEIKKTRYVDSRSNQHIMRFDIEPSGIRPAYLSTSKISRDILDGKFDVVIISDYDKGFLNRRQVISLTSRLVPETRLYVDTKKKDVGCYQNSFIKLNEKESKMSGSTLHDSSLLITTLGATGARYLKNEYPSKKVDVFDVSGAGDTFLVAFAIYHAITAEPSESIKFANKCASIVVQQIGTYALRQSDLEK